jgi:hypothetical protein
LRISSSLFTATTYLSLSSKLVVEKKSQYMHLLLQKGMWTYIPAIADWL